MIHEIFRDSADISDFQLSQTGDVISSSLSSARVEWDERSGGSRYCNEKTFTETEIDVTTKKGKSSMGRGRENEITR